MNEHPRHRVGSAAEPMLDDAPSIVPDLIGLGLEEACAAAAWAGTRVDVTYVARGRAPWGIVVAQSPSPGTRMRARWQIHVLVPVASPADEQRDA